MGTRTKIDFQAIKEAVSLEQVMQWLQLPAKRSGAQWRCECPVHGGGLRGLAITPAEGWYCHQAHKGGDCIALYAHIKECGNYDAAEAISEHFGIAAPREKEASHTSRSAKEDTQMKPLDYLEPTHQVLDLLGLTPAICKALGAGFAPKGTMLNRIAIPLRLASGRLVGYVGIATEPDQKPLLKFPPNLEEMCGGEPEPTIEEPEKHSTDDMRKLLRVV